MRLWHENLIKYLPRQQLLGQHRECAALRGNGWGKTHATVNYVFEHSPYKLFQYHQQVIKEMKNRGYQPDEKWLDANYRGQSCFPYTQLLASPLTYPIYPEHNEHYLLECLDNLKKKGILIDYY